MYDIWFTYTLIAYLSYTTLNHWKFSIVKLVSYINCVMSTEEAVTSRRAVACSQASRPTQISWYGTHDNELEMDEWRSGRRSRSAGAANAHSMYSTLPAKNFKLPKPRRPLSNVCGSSLPTARSRIATYFDSLTRRKKVGII